MKKKILIFAVILSVSGTLSIMANDIFESEEPEPQRKLTEIEKRAAKAALGDRVNGEKLFKMNCAACHGFMQRGDGALSANLNPPPSNLRDGKVMNSLTHAQLIELIQKGGPKVGKSASMPAFGYSFSQLQIWDLVGYLRTLYPSISEFFPEARFYTSKMYEIAEYGRKRVERALGKPLTKEEASIVVFTVYKPSEGAPDQPPELIPQIPAKLDALKKRDKLGYLMFIDLELDGPKKVVPVAVTLDNGGTIRKFMLADPTLPDAAKHNSMLSKFVGRGQRGGKYDISKVAVKDKAAKSYEKGVYKLWLRALEACFMFEQEERERSWADEAFGPKKEVKHEEVEFKVK